MTCGNESHWDDYDPNCNPCENEIRELIRRGTYTEREFNLWKKGALKIGLKRYEFV